VYLSCFCFANFLAYARKCKTHAKLQHIDTTYFLSLITDSAHFPEGKISKTKTRDIEVSNIMYDTISFFVC